MSLCLYVNVSCFLCCEAGGLRFTYEGIQDMAFVSSYSTTYYEVWLLWNDMENHDNHVFYYDYHDFYKLF